MNLFYNEYILLYCSEYNQTLSLFSSYKRETFFLEIHKRNTHQKKKNPHSLIVHLEKSSLDVIENVPSDISPQFLTLSEINNAEIAMMAY